MCFAFSWFLLSHFSEVRESFSSCLVPWLICFASNVRVAFWSRVLFCWAFLIFLNSFDLSQLFSCQPDLCLIFKTTNCGAGYFYEVGEVLFLAGFVIYILASILRLTRSLGKPIMSVAGVLTGIYYMFIERTYSTTDNPLLRWHLCVSILRK